METFALNENRKMGTTTLDEESMRARGGRRRVNHMQVHHALERHDGAICTLEKSGNVVGGGNSLGNGP